MPKACPLWFMSNGEDVHLCRLQCSKLEWVYTKMLIFHVHRFVILIIKIGYSEIKVICSLIIANTLLFIKVQYLYIYTYSFMYIDLFCIFIQDIGVKKPCFGMAECTISGQIS